MFESLNLPDDLTAVGDAELRDVLIACERAAGAAQARQVEVIAEMARREEGKPDPRMVDVMQDRYRFLIDEIAVELSISKVAAAHRFHLARELDGRPLVLSALCDGHIDLNKAGEIMDQLGSHVSDDVRSSLEADVIAYARTHTRSQVRAWLRRRVMASDTSAAEKARCRARENRKFVHYPGLDGMSTLVADLPAPDAIAVWRMVDQVAQASRFAADEQKSEGDVNSCDERTMDQRRADALVDLLLGRADRSPVVELMVTVSQEALTGDSDEPGELAGYGPIDASQARELATDASLWRRVLLEAGTGLALDASAAYRPPRAMARTIEVRDQTCRFPGCRRAAAGCDLDHTVPWPAGRTEVDNLAALCRSHHLLKHRAGWSVRQTAGAVLEWTSPSGRQFRTTPADHRTEAERARAPDRERVTSRAA